MRGADALVGTGLDFGAGLLIGLPKLLLSGGKLGALARPFCSWNDGALTSLIVLPGVDFPHFRPLAVSLADITRPGGGRRHPRLRQQARQPYTLIPR